MTIEYTCTICRQVILRTEELDEGGEAVITRASGTLNYHISARSHDSFSVESDRTDIVIDVVGKGKIKNREVIVTGNIRN